MPRPFTTSYAYPWALIRRGGKHQSGTPHTRVAFIRRAIAKDGRIVEFRGLIGNSDLQAFSLTERSIAPADIIKGWRHEPTPAAIARAKARVRA